MKNLFLRALLIVLFPASFALMNGATAQQLKQDPKLIKGKLPNGFTYYIYPNNNPEKHAVLRLMVNAGSLQEDKDQQGLAHFVEHMAFNGTKNYSKNEVISFLESKGVKFGADLNAHTSFDETVYKIAINTEKPENIEKAIDIMADWAFDVTFDSLEIEKERGVVIEEWRSKQGADNRLRDQYMPVLFHNSRYTERMPIGKVDILKHFSRQRIVDFYKKWYRPDLMGIVVVTDTDPKLVEQYIRKQFGGHRAASTAKRQYYSLPVHADTLVSIATDKEATATELSFFTKMPSLVNISTEKSFQEYLKRIFLNNLSKARFARISQLENDFKSGSLSVSNIILKNGILGGGVSLYSDQIDAGINGYLFEVERIFRFGYTKTEIEKLKKEYLQQLQKAVDNNKAQSSTFADLAQEDFYEGNTMLAREEKFRLVKKMLPQIDSAQLLSYLRGLRKKGNTVLMLTAPDTEKAQLPSEAKLRRMLSGSTSTVVTAWSDAVVVPEKLLAIEPVSGKIISENEYKEVGVTEWKLSNGITVYLKRASEQKQNIMLSGFREGGIYALDSSKYITALFSKNILAGSGVGEFSRRALSQYLEGNSASASIILSNSREGVVAGADWKDVRTMFQLIYLKWTAPRVDDAVFEKISRQVIEGADNGKVTPTYAYNRAISKILGGDDYVSDRVTSSRIRAELKKEEILPVFKSRFNSAAGFQFVIVGDFPADSVRTLVEKYLGGLPGGEIKAGYVYKGPSGGEKAEDILMYGGESPRSVVNLFFQSNDLKYDYPVIMKQQLLEEVLKVKLRMNLREENSGVYGVAVSLSSTNKPAELFRARVSFTCAPESAIFLSDQARKEIDRVAKQPDYFATELTRIKTQMIDQHKKQVNKNSYWSAGLRNHFYNGFTGWDYFSDYEKLLQEITPAEVSAFATKYLVQTPCIKAVLMPASYDKTGKATTK